MKISVITVAFNSAQTIARAAASVISQNRLGFELEYIVVDGNSSDGTLLALEPYRPGIDLLISEPDQGIYYAMNKGWQAATGEVIAFLNSDDAYADDQVLQDVVQAFEEGIDVVYGDLVYVSAGRTVRTWVSGKYAVGSFKTGWMPPHPTFFARRELFQSLGGFNTALRSASDYELMLRFVHLNRSTVAYVPRTLVHMEVGGVSNASWINRLRSNAEDREAWRLNLVRPALGFRFLKPLRKLRQFLR